MRRLLATLSTSLAATLAIVSVCAASASAALPEYITHSKQFPVAFISASHTGERVFFETKSGSEFGCNSLSGTGDITGAKTDQATFTFSGCTLGEFGSCQNEGAAEGVVKTNPLSSTLGYIVKATKRVGDALAPTTNGGSFEEFECAGLPVVVRGSLIGEYTAASLNKMTTKTELVFTQAAGVQAVQKLEGGATDVLEISFDGGAFEELGVSTKDAITTAEDVEIKA